MVRPVLLDSTDGEAWFRLAAQAPFGVSIWRAESDDPADIRLIYANARAAEESGVPMPELVGRTVGELFPTGLDAPPRDNIPAAWLRVATTERGETMHAVPYGDDEHPMGWFRIHFIPLGDRRVASLYENVTRQMAASRELEQFAHAASHDLQAPLRTIAGFVELLVEALGDDLGERPRRFTEHIRQGVDRMRGHVRGLLDYARAGQRASTRPVLVSAVLADVRQELRGLIDETGARFVVGDLPVVSVPRVGLHRLLLNLIDNALKYRSDAPPVIEVTGEPVPTGWRITVADNGLGIPPGREAQAFEMFRRLHPPATASGSGLGLAVCRRTVEMWGGQIALDARPEGGTAILFTIPEPALEPRD